MNVYGMLGGICGLVVGLILAMVLIKFINRDGALKTRYDERQQATRGRGFQYGFVGMAVMAGIMMIIGIGEISLPVVDAVTYFVIIATGLLTAISYFIWNEAYWGINTNQPRFYIIMAIAVVCNIIPVVSACIEGDFLVDGVLGISGINLICGIMCLIVVIEAAVKIIIDRKAGEE